MQKKFTEDSSKRVQKKSPAPTGGKNIPYKKWDKKKKNSVLKTSKNYKKPYNRQGR